MKNKFKGIYAWIMGPAPVVAHVPKLSMVETAEGTEAVMNVSGIIGWNDDELLPFVDDLAKAKNEGVKEICLRINSPGGDVFTALAMYDALKECGIPVRAEIYGLAASAASLLAMVADKILMNENGKMMIHQPSAGIWGTVDEIKSYSDFLMGERQRLFAIYATRMGKTWEEISNSHGASVWYTLEEAQSAGLVDGKLEGDSTEEEEIPIDPEEEEPVTGGITSSMTLFGKMKAYVGKVFMKTPEQSKSEANDDKIADLKNQLNAQIALNNRLQNQIDTQSENQEKLIQKRVTAQMAALGLPVNKVPAPSSDEQNKTIMATIACPKNMDEFLTMSASDRQMVAMLYPEQMRDWVK